MFTAKEIMYGTNGVEDLRGKYLFAIKLAPEETPVCFFEHKKTPFLFKDVRIMDEKEMASIDCTNLEPSDIVIYKFSDTGYTPYDTFIFVNNNNSLVFSDYEHRWGRFGCAFELCEMCIIGDTTDDSVSAYQIRLIDLDRVKQEVKNTENQHEKLNSQTFRNMALPMHGSTFGLIYPNGQCIII